MQEESTPEEPQTPTERLGIKTFVIKLKARADLPDAEDVTWETSVADGVTVTNVAIDMESFAQHYGVRAQTVKDYIGRSQSQDAMIPYA
ncbi:hypothetical protein JKP88DRAFT_280824 [Tribonema minus]|uniref:Uncharacterized protein n=1 Tax=Tribonema minus TaxID=303371 RepID=A0A835YRU6_9STRA|nr:hypothetical protein JKP88DRAFT_280824 [Tribonema minus]